MRYGFNNITSRSGLTEKVDFLIKPETNILNLEPKDEKIYCVLVDEAQFLDPAQIDQLRLATGIFIFIFGVVLINILW